MILTYALNTQDSTTLQVIPLMAEIKLGRPLGRTVYPAQADRLLKEPPSNLSLDKLDRRILMQLVMHQSARGKEIFFSGKAAAQVLEDLVSTGRCYLWDQRDAPLTRVDPIAGAAVWREEGDGFVACFDLPSRAEVVPCTPPYAIHRGALGVAPIESGLPDDAASSWRRAGVVSPERAVQFAERLQREYPEAVVPPPPQIEVQTIEDMLPTPIARVLFEQREEDALNSDCLTVVLLFEYGGKEIVPSDGVDRVRFVSEGTMYDIRRQREFEIAAIARLEQFGFERMEAPTEDLFAAASQRDCWVLQAGGDWFDVKTRAWPELEADGWRTESGSGELVVIDETSWYSDMEQSGRGWFSFEAGIRLGDRKVNVLPLLRSYLSAHAGQTLEQMEEDLRARHLPVPTGQGVALVPGERLFFIMRHLFELFSGQKLDKDSMLRLDSWRAAEVADLETLSERPWKAPASLRKLSRSLQEGVDISEAQEPEAFGTELRPYQRLGLGWLRFLRDHELGGVLADDMGLGKTVQMIALLAEDHAAGTLTQPTLVVVPTSLMSNWRTEIERFAPALRVVVMHGSDRHDRDVDLTDFDVIITTYALLRNDEDIYRSMVFSYVILDEAQAIKNPDSRSAKVACEIKARVRFCMTGTPMENHLGDLWSLFNFAIPGFLGARRAFKSQFRVPIEVEGHPVLPGVLRKRIRPFLLRRTKDAVAPELPPKTEIVQRVTLSLTQHDQYQSVLMAMSKRIRETVEERGFARSRITILDALLKLREVCCDPRLREPDREYAIPEDCAKLAALAEMLPEMVDEGRRILLFSSFTRMLSLIEVLCDELGIPYVTLTGSTTKRDVPIEAFSKGEVPLFLISLKAGGVGLNLTAADTVIHYDPWWNPASEEQATDRAHRIGQDKPVFVYKLIAEGSIEDRILDMQKRKKALVAELVQDHGNVTNLSMTQEDLDLLLAPLVG